MLPAATQQLVSRIAECGWLHNHIRKFVDRVRGDKASGKVMIALGMAIDEQLQEYYRLVSRLAVCQSELFSSWSRAVNAVCRRAGAGLVVN